MMTTPEKKILKRKIIVTSQWKPKPGKNMGWDLITVKKIHRNCGKTILIEFEEFYSLWPPGRLIDSYDRVII